MHGQIQLSRLQATACLHGQHDGTVAVGDMDQIAIPQLQALHVLGVNLQLRLAHMGEQAAQLAGACHAMPLIAQATGIQTERVARIALHGHGLPRLRIKAGTAVIGYKPAVGVQALRALRCTAGHRPLLRAFLFQHLPAQAGDVQISPTRAFAVLVPDGLGCSFSTAHVIAK